MNLLKATIVFKLNAEDELPLDNINAHLRNLITDNLHERLELVNIDYANVEIADDLGSIRDLNHEAESLIRAMDMNTWALWTPDMKKVVEAIILHKVDFEDEGQYFQFDGVDFEKLNLEKALKERDDFGEGLSSD